MIDPAASTRRVYALLGSPAVHVSALGVRTPGVPVIFEAASASMDGVIQAEAPTIKLPASAIAAGVRRGDRFELGADVWRAREDGLPLRDGEELSVPVAKAAP